MPEQPAVVAFWHGEMLPVWKFFAQVEEKQKYAVVSMSRDGEILSQLLEKYGYRLLRGSSSRNGKEILSQAVEIAKEATILMTPDGPRGPAGKFKAGAAVIAQRSGSHLYLIRSQVSIGKVFEKSWDKFILPMPFSRINLHISENIIVSADISKEAVSEMIAEFELTLNNMI